MSHRRVIGLVRRYAPLAVALACVSLVAGGVPPVVFGSHRAAPGILAPGSAGSVAVRHWWDPRGWVGGGSSPRPRTLAAGGGPQTARLPRQAALPAPRRVRELTARRSATTRVYQLADGRLQAEVSGVPVNYQDSHGG